MSTGIGHGLDRVLKQDWIGTRADRNKPCVPRLICTELEIQRACRRGLASHMEMSALAFPGDHNPGSGQTHPNLSSPQCVP